MSERPAAVVTPPDFIRDQGLAAVLRVLPDARIVGGAVRDTLAGRPVADVDLATPRTPGTVIAALRDAGIMVVPTGVAHGTVTAVLDRRGFEITTLRRDVDTDGRHAVVEYSDDWREDAARRDFTINAMSMTPGGEVFDYYGGIGDLAGGRVRFVGEAGTRIREDYLRALRFFRFFARYGSGAPDAAATVAIAANVDGLSQLSPERVWSELKRILSVADVRPAPGVDGALSLMAALGVLSVILPNALSPPVPVSELPPDPLLRLAALLPGQNDTDRLASRFRLANAERDKVLALGQPALGEDASDGDIRRALAGTARETLIGRAWLAGRSAALRDRIGDMQAPGFPLRGRDLLEAGAVAGPRLGSLLGELRELWMASGCSLGEDALRAELARRLAP